LIDNPEFPSDDRTCWYWDTNRPLEGEQPYIAVECYSDRNPNEFVFVEGLRLLFTDQAEYCAVCPNCYVAFANMQWSGSTHSPGWREQSHEFLERHQRDKGWCEFCDPVFGNGGWLPHEWCGWRQ